MAIEYRWGYAGTIDACGSSISSEPTTQIRGRRARARPPSRSSAETASPIDETAMTLRCGPAFRAPLSALTVAPEPRRPRHERQGVFSTTPPTGPTEPLFDIVPVAAGAHPVGEVGTMKFSMRPRVNDNPADGPTIPPEESVTSNGTPYAIGRHDAEGQAGLCGPCASSGRKVRSPNRSHSRVDPVAFDDRARTPRRRCGAFSRSSS